MRDFVFPCLFVSDRIFCCRMVEHTQGHKGDGTLRRSDASVHEQCMWMWLSVVFLPQQLTVRAPLRGPWLQTVVVHTVGTWEHVYKEEREKRRTETKRETSRIEKKVESE